MDHPHQEVAFPQGLGTCLRPGDLPRHPGQGGGEEVFALAGARQLDPQRSLGLCRPELFKDLLPQHLLGNADADRRHGRLFHARLNVVAQKIAQVEEPLLVADGDMIKVSLLEGELDAAAVQQAEVCSKVRVIGGDDEIKMDRHGDC